MREKTWINEFLKDPRTRYLQYKIAAPRQVRCLRLGISRTFRKKTYPNIKNICKLKVGRGRVS